MIKKDLKDILQTTVEVDKNLDCHAVQVTEIPDIIEQIDELDEADKNINNLLETIAHDRNKLGEKLIHLNNQLSTYDCCISNVRDLIKRAIEKILKK